VSKKGGWGVATRFTTFYFLFRKGMKEAPLVVGRRATRNLKPVRNVIKNEKSVSPLPHPLTATPKGRLKLWRTQMLCSRSLFSQTLTKIQNGVRPPT